VKPASKAAPGIQKQRKGFCLAPALIAFTFLAFSNSFATGFALDSQMLILGDSRIQNESADNIGLILNHSYWWPNGEAGLYRPLATLSYLLNYAILGSGRNPTGYHWINLILHLANVLLALVLVRRLLEGREYAVRAAFLVALLWAAHPLLTESVTNIAGRPDLLAGFSILGGLVAYLNSAVATRWRRALWLIVLALITAVGVFSKESAAILAGIILLYECLCGVRLRAALWGCGATLVPVALMLWKRTAVLSATLAPEFPFVDNPITGAGFWIGRLTAVKVLGRYLWLSIWPARLSSDYSYSQIPLARGSAEDWIAWLGVGVAIVLAALLFRTRRLALFFVGFAFLNLLPTANLLFPIGTIMAERFMYLPVLGCIACIVLALQGTGLSVPRGTGLVVASVLASAYAVRTWTRNLDWASDLTMAAATVQTSPQSFKPHWLWATALFQTDPEHKNLDRAIAEADRSVAILSPLPDELDVPGPWNLAATLRLAKGDALAEQAARQEYMKAAATAQRSIAIDKASRAAYALRHGVPEPVPPAAANGIRILASAYLRMHEADQALEQATRARTIDPNNAEVYTQIADADLLKQRGEDAAIALAQGMFATSDPGLRQDLLKLYQSGLDSKGCAVVAGPRGPALNPSCEIVRRDLCEGTTRAGRQDLRQQLGCPN